MDMKNILVSLALIVAILAGGSWIWGAWSGAGDGAVPGVNLYPITGEAGIVESSSDITLAQNQSGSTYLITSSSTVTLPAVREGLNYQFVVSTAIPANFVIDSAEGDNIEGALIVAGAVVDCNAVDQVNFVGDGENLGDYVRLISDGISWHIVGSGALTTAKLTCTDPS